MRKIGLLIAVFVACVAVSLVILAMSGVKLPSANLDDQQGQTPTQTGENERNWRYGGIRADGSLALIDKDDVEVVIDLQDRKWQSPSFDPRGAAFAVLSETAENIYDIYTYNFAKSELRRDTFYGDGAQGITGYFWDDSGHIYFTQGVEPDNWLHRYDFENREVRKLFRTFGRLVNVDYVNDQLLFAIDTQDSREYELTNLDGKKIKSFISADIVEDAKLTMVLPTLDPFQLIARVRVGDVLMDYIWDAGTDEYRKIEYVASSQLKLSQVSTDLPDLLCNFEGQLFYARVITGENQAIAVVNYDLGSYQLLHTWSDATESTPMFQPHCVDSAVIWGGEIAGEHKWWRANRMELQQLTFADGYTQLVAAEVEE
jgi:hypothetical protein